MRSNADGQNNHKNMEGADDIAALLRMVASDEMELQEVVQPGIGVDKAKINAFIQQQQKKSTVDCTKRDMKIVYKCLVGEKHDLRNVENIAPHELNLLLSEFYMDIKRNDGSEYEPGILNSLKSSIDRYLQENEYECSLREKQFKLSNKTLASKKVQLKKLGKGRKQHASKAVTTKEEDILWQKGQLVDSSPRIVQFTLWYYFTKCFGLRGRGEHRQLMMSDITLKQDTDGREYLEYQERITKTRDGTGKSDTRDSTPRLYSTGNERNPVDVYKTFLHRRPVVPGAEKPFYLTCMPIDRIDSDVWYYPRPMGKNTLGQLMSMAASESRLERKTNHSVRKSIVKHFENTVYLHTKLCR
jgi:hypothetical protein